MNMLIKVTSKESYIVKSANGNRIKRHVETSGIPLKHSELFESAVEKLGVDANFEGLKAYSLNDDSVQVIAYNRRILGAAVTFFGKVDNIKKVLDKVSDYYLKNITESRVQTSNKLFLSNIYGE